MEDVQIITLLGFMLYCTIIFKMIPAKRGRDSFVANLARTSKGQLGLGPMPKFVFFIFKGFNFFNIEMV